MGNNVPHQLALSDIVCASPNQVASRVGDEVAILDLDGAVYYGLDPVGTRIWDLIQQPTPLTKVLSAVVSEFEVDEVTARVDLLALVTDLLSTRLVELHSAGSVLLAGEPAHFDR